MKYSIWVRMPRPSSSYERIRGVGGVIVMPSALLFLSLKYLASRHHWSFEITSKSVPIIKLPVADCRIMWLNWASPSVKQARRS